MNFFFHFTREWKTRIYKLTTRSSYIYRYIRCAEQTKDVCGIANEVGIRKMPRQRCFAKFLLHSPSPYSKRRHHFVSPIYMKTSTIIYVACEMRPRYSRRQIEYIGHRTGYHTAPKMSTGITLRLITSFSTSIYIVHISLEKPKMHRTPIRKSDRSQNSRIHRLQNGPSYHVQMVLMHRHQVVQTASPMKISNDSSTKRLFVSLTKVQKQRPQDIQ